MTESDIPTPWNPRLSVTPDTLTGKFGVEVNFGMGFPWIATSMANPFRIAKSGPIFESEESAKEAGEFIVDALEILLREAKATAGEGHDT